MKTRLSPALAAFLGCSAAAFAEVKLPALISDNMVLLHDAKANVWGTADAGEKVTVTLGDKKVSTSADENGKWSVKLEGLTPGSGKEMTIAGKNTLSVENVAIGEVWVASGQSNMEFGLKGATNSGQEIAAAKFPDLRVFTVTKKGSKSPLEDCAGKWEIATPENAGHFSAVGYFFIRELHQKLRQPIGLIHTSWGGTPVETWIPESGMKSNVKFGEHWKKKLAAYPAAKEAFGKGESRGQACPSRTTRAGRAGGSQCRAKRTLQRHDRACRTLHDPRCDLVPGREQRWAEQPRQHGPLRPAFPHDDPLVALRICECAGRVTR